MNTDKLISIITEEVLKRITVLSLQNSKDKSKSILILDSISNKNSYDEIISKWKDIKFLDDYCHEEGVDLFDYIIVPKLSSKDLVGIAIGDIRSDVSEIIIDGVFKGKKVIVFEEGISYRKFKNTANKNFFNMFKGYEEKIISFGIEIVRKKDLTECLDNGYCKSENEISNETNKVLEEIIKEAVITKKVISEKDIENLWNKGYKTIAIDKKSIITPLAKDFIRTNQINIKS
ncbi:hypothetical protein [Caminicella sporogenes]|uniref:hypothetical protein n=1 Tax=Caminicella sporogenes TaxID=166485 RepID=UPI0025404CEB|nr:hypothetical protein [Caminicella sporogenes]WIF95531.1 hypothetical protein QNI18_02560 [Caminicella sporogenes]